MCGIPEANYEMALKTGAGQSRVLFETCLRPRAQRSKVTKHMAYRYAIGYYFVYIRIHSVVFVENQVAPRRRVP